MQAEPLDIDGLYRAYASYVGTIALRILGDGADADDVVQDTFLAAFTHLDALREPAAARVWLGRIAVRAAQRRLRRRKFTGFFGVQVDIDVAAVAPGASPEEALQLRELYEALQQLPAAERVAWTLRHVQRETLPAVAALTDCSLATAKRRIAAAAAKLDRRMNRD